MPNIHDPGSESVISTSQAGEMLSIRAKAVLIMALSAELLIVAPSIFHPKHRFIAVMRQHDLRAASVTYGRVNTNPTTWSVNAEPDRVFPYYSLSKPITAAVVTRLADDRVLSLDEPAFGSSPRQLLRHSGGRDWHIAGDPVVERKGPARCTEVGPTKLQFAPGTKQVYSNLGYCLLGQLVEQRTRREFPQVTWALIPETRTMRYDDWLGPAGGWSGTSEAYWQFASRPLDDQVTEAPSGMRHDYYGLGWRVSPAGLSHFGQFAQGYTVVVRRGNYVAVALFEGQVKDGRAALEQLRPILYEMP